MIGHLRKFSSSIYAKIFLVIVAIPFIFWGMGPVFQSGKKNTIVEIGKEKIKTQEFLDYVKFHATSEQIVDKKFIDKLLSEFIGNKLINLESNNLEIKLSNDSLAKIIKNEKIFMKNEKFSRIEYEKFLVKNSLNAATFEQNISEQVKKEQVFDFISGGIIPSNFLVNIIYDKINQKRDVQIINLNDIFIKKNNFTEKQIKDYFEKNKNKYNEIYKSINFVKLDPKKLTGSDEYNNLYFEKIDKIDDLIVEGMNLNFILKKFELDSSNSAFINKLGLDKKGEMIKHLPNELIKNVFNITESEPTMLFEQSENYFIIELNKTENIQKEVSDAYVKKDIIQNLEKKIKREFVTKIIDKINKNNFSKNNFDELAKKENVKINKIVLNNQNDDKLLKKELINQIYSFGEKKTIVVADIGLSENFLVYIEKIYNTSIDKNSEDYKKYFNISRAKMKSNLYATYDSYLSQKYKININYNALDTIKNYF